MNYEYISAKEASVVLKCSRRAAHNILHSLFEDKMNKKNPLAKKNPLVVDLIKDLKLELC